MERKEGGKKGGWNLKKNLNAQAVVFVFLIISHVFISVRLTKIVAANGKEEGLKINYIYIRDEKKKK